MPLHDNSLVHLKRGIFIEFIKLDYKSSGKGINLRSTMAFAIWSTRTVRTAFTMGTTSTPHPTLTIGSTITIRKASTFWIYTMVRTWMMIHSYPLQNNYFGINVCKLTNLIALLSRQSLSQYAVVSD